MPRIYSGHPIPALRPEQSDHVPWADCPQGLSSSTGCPVSHSSLPVALLASLPPCGALLAAPKAPLGPRFPSGQFALLTRREKGSYCPFCRRGSQCRAQWSWAAFTSSWSALVLAFFRRQNGRAFFPPLPIAALLPRRWRWADSNSGAWDASMRLEYFCNAKGQRDFKSTLAFLASHEACRRMAVFSIQQTRKTHQTGEPRGPLPSGGKTTAKSLFLSAPATERRDG